MPKSIQFNGTVILAVTGVLLVLITASAGIHGAIEGVVDRLSGYIARHAVLGAISFTGLAAVSVLLAGISSALLIPVGVRHWGEVTTLILLWSGWVAGGVLTYFIGRGVGSRVALWLVSGKKIKYYQDRITNQASFPLILLFQASLPSEIPGYVLGTAKYPFALYFTALAVVELPFAAGAVLLGDSFLKRQYWLVIVGAAIGVGFMLWATNRLNQKLSPPK